MLPARVFLLHAFALIVELVRAVAHVLSTRASLSHGGHFACSPLGKASSTGVFSPRFFAVFVRNASLSNMVSRHVSFVHDTRTRASVSRDSRSFQCYISAMVSPTGRLLARCVVSTSFGTQWWLTCWCTRPIASGRMVFQDWPREQKVTSSGSAPLPVFLEASDR